jgi:hypothetical protein
MHPILKQVDCWIFNYDVTVFLLHEYLLIFATPPPPPAIPAPLKADITVFTSCIFYSHFSLPILSACFIKGRLIRDFQLQVFFISKFLPGP